MKKIIILFILISSLAYSFPYNMYTGMTGALRLGGTLYLDNMRIGNKKYTLSSPIMLNFGILKNFDIFARVLPLTYIPEVGVGVEGEPQFSIMPRFQFFNGFIGAVEVLFPGSSKQKFGLNPQIHYLIGLGDFFTMYANLEVPMFFDDPRGVVNYIRLKTAIGVYPGSLFGFSLAGIYLEYHLAYDFYNKAMLGLNHLGLGVYLVLNSDASLSINFSPYVEQLASGYYFGIGAYISYTLDFNKFIR
ncbi:hypothetical protein [Brachyspira pilosicoli]|uniref:Uncharacterized protein n=1 Tax=Brachyspira pilosicoli TaxID=52584 RepID=A0A5C8FB05_BRAPL|nr:hypothetical protein [Brachyspira pilosicoli]TXJ47445.1 hypothetical protein EPJ72_00310 [Brachyspira pilosicoli]